ncbi:ABC transporter permease [Kaistia terrae]|jgi:ribose transport system permease protein|uniref:ABC transporter permease n=1 Tax=Kaistia terrae TaxID=537017 RepID=A0ABW0PRE0_9HYPH|nr:ABC transporter permease [Kaistia terrae]MCX5578450.1 ABC transporter permease [Kaistia terrae]
MSAVSEPIDGLGRDSTNWAATALTAIGLWARRYPVWIFLAAALVFFSLKSPHFLSVFNLSNILLQAAFFGFLSIGLTLLIISRNIDLTVGSVAGLAACLAVGLQPSLGLWLPIAIGLGAGLAIGLLNGFLVERAGIDSFIVTLAGMIGIKGLAFAFAGEESISASIDLFNELGALRIGRIHAIALLFLALLAIGHYVLKHTKYGRETYAIGGNRTAAVNAGVRVSRHVIIGFAISGLLAAFCGIAMAANMGAAMPAFGLGYEGWAIAAVVLGGTKLSGGSGRIVNTLGGVLLLASLRNGLNMIHVPAYYVLVTIGGALILALFFDTQFSRKPRQG